MITLQINNSNGAVVIYGNPNNPPVNPPPAGYSNYTVESIPVQATGDKTNVLLWQKGALAWVQPPATLATLSAALNNSLTVLFQTTSVQIQIVFSNLAGPNGSITQLIKAGQLAVAIQALQGIIDDGLVPAKYFSVLTQAIELITSQEAAFTSVMV